MLFNKKKKQKENRKQETVCQEKPVYILSSVFPSREVQEIAMNAITNSGERL